MNFRVEWFDQLSSTNAHVRERFLSGEAIESGWVAAAREQTAGRGRQGRTWLSAPGRDLCCSIFVATDAELAAIPSLTMAVALAVTDVLNNRGIPADPKWPNDVRVGGKKICGILSEGVERAAAPSTGVIVGIGLNVNMSEDDAATIDQPATSICIETGRRDDVGGVLESLFAPLGYWLGEWDAGGFARLRETWTEKAGPIGAPLTVREGGVTKSGALAGFGEYGELKLRTGAGIETIWSGDLT